MAHTTLAVCRTKVKVVSVVKVGTLTPWLVSFNRIVSTLFVLQVVALAVVVWLCTVLST